MKRLVLLVCGLILLLGCGTPTPEPALEPCRELIAAHSALQNEFDALQSGYDRVNENYMEVVNRYNDLVYQYQALHTNYVMLEGYYQYIGEQYANLVVRIGTTQTVSDEALRELNERYQALLEGAGPVDERLRAVNDRRVKLLSDYLTDSEYEAFYKGWDLLWLTLKE